MNTLQERHHGPTLWERLTRWRGPLTLGCLLVAGFAFLWALPGGLFRSAVASSRNTTPRTKPIEQIVPGDLVLAHDPESGETRAKKVLRVFRNVSDHLRLLTVRNADGTTQVLRTTDGHPFWLPDRGWVAAGELKVGQELVQADGQPATLVKTAYEAHPEGVPIFNFEVEGFHTYFVAAHGTRAPPILVHNTSPTPNNPSQGRIDPNIPKPKVPPSSIFGRSFQDWGRDVIRWGTGAEGARARMGTITLQELRQAGVAEAQVQAARQFYAQVAARDPRNAAAAARVQLMDHILVLLKGG